MRGIRTYTYLMHPLPLFRMLRGQLPQREFENDIVVTWGQRPTGGLPLPVLHAANTRCQYVHIARMARDTLRAH